MILRFCYVNDFCWNKATFLFKIILSKFDLVRTEEVEIVAMLLLLDFRKTVRRLMLVILLVKKQKRSEYKNDDIVS